MIFTEKEKNKIRSNWDDRISNRNKQLSKQLRIQSVKHMKQVSLFGSDDICQFNLSQLTNEANKLTISTNEKKIRKAFIDKIEKTINNNIFKIFLFGKAGTGKTYLAESIMNTLMKQEKAVLFLNINELKNLAYKSFNKDNEANKKVNQIINFAKRCDVLILDDLATESSNSSTSFHEANDYIQSMLYEIANERINKSNIITSNFSRDELKNIYNEKIISRLMPSQNSLPLTFSAFTDLR